MISREVAKRWVAMAEDMRVLGAISEELYDEVMRAIREWLEPSKK